LRYAVARDSPRAFAASSIDSPAKRCSVGHTGRGGVFGRKAKQCLVEREQQMRIAVALAGHIGERNVTAAAASFLPPLGTSVVDEDSPHRFGRGGEKVASVREFLIAHQPQIGFVDQGRRIERVMGRFDSHPRHSERPQLGIHEREQVRRRVMIAARCGVEYA
jgi:hypothetical protein